MKKYPTVLRVSKFCVTKLKKENKNTLEKFAKEKSLRKKNKNTLG
jgi:hypothetical protein